MASGRPGDRRPLRIVRAIAFALVATAIAACATIAPPKPWEKEVLARPDMQFDANPLDTKTSLQIYTSKEAATGGYGVGGGGCGCN